MPDLNLNSLTLSDLEHLRREISKAIAEVEDRRRSAARAAVEAKAREFGFTLADLRGFRPKDTRVRSQPKYRNPKDGSITWTGRGRKPNWFTAAIASGISADSMGASEFEQNI